MGGGKQREGKEKCDNGRGGSPTGRRMREEKAFALIIRATIDGGGEERAGLYFIQAETLNTFLSGTIARNGG